MATIPSFEKVILEIAQALGVKSTKEKERFAHREMTLDKRKEVLTDLFKRICDALTDDLPTKRDMFGQFMCIASVNDELQNQTFTYGADQRQVFWYLLGYVYVPFLARVTAFWQDMGSTEYVVYAPVQGEVDRYTPKNGALDEGMPGGAFWYLPWHEHDGKPVIMPVAQVLDWFLDLAGKSIDQVSLELEKSKKTAKEAERIKRTLYKWREGVTSEIATIEEFFRDDCTLQFAGCFTFDDRRDLSGLMDNARNFIDKKGLTPERLAAEIPMSSERISTVLDNTASTDDVEYFIDKLSQRYAQPDMRIVRKRFRIARAIQDGYERLVKTLCPGVDKSEADPSRNKVLQLIIMYSHIYNLTIEAKQYGGNDPDLWICIKEEDCWFEEQLKTRYAELYATDIFKMILPSHIENRDNDADYLAGKFSQLFLEMKPGDELEDLWPYDDEDESRKAIQELTLGRLLKGTRLTVKIAELRQKILKGAPYRALQSEADFWVVKSICCDKNIPARIRDMARVRMKEVAQTDAEQMIAIMAQLGHYLNGERKGRPEDCKEQVEKLLGEAENNQRYEHFKPQILQYRAKHLLSQNLYDDAEAYFRESWNRCLENNIGPMRGEIARDLFGLKCSRFRFSNDSLLVRLYGDCLLFGIFDDNKYLPAMEDSATHLSEYYWEDLYKPYPGVKKDSPPIKDHVKHIWELTRKFIETDDFSILEEWLDKHPELKKDRIRDVRGDTIVSLWLKYSLNETGQFRNHLEKATEFVATKWPKLLNFQDFKAQTPLMLATEANRHELVRVFLSLKAKTDLQDFKCQTALFGACRGRAVECVRLLLDADIDTNLRNMEGGTALHAAVRFGHPEIVQMIVAKNSALKSVKNDQGKTPLDVLTSEILPNLSAYAATMFRACGRKAGTHAEYLQIEKILLAGNIPS